MQEMIDRRLYPTSETYINMLDHLALGGHGNLIPTVWQKVEFVDYLNEDVQPLIQKFSTRSDYESALQLILCSALHSSETNRDLPNSPKGVQ